MSGLVWASSARLWDNFWKKIMKQIVDAVPLAEEMIKTVCSIPKLLKQVYHWSSWALCSDLIDPFVIYLRLFLVMKITRSKFKNLSALKLAPNLNLNIFPLKIQVLRACYLCEVWKKLPFIDRKTDIFKTTTKFSTWTFSREKTRRGKMII